MKRALALSLLVAACGKTVPLLPDGKGSGDAAVDAVPPTDASQSINVTVLSTDGAATPQESIAVIMLDASGALIASGTTDANGQFTHTTSAGASITIIRVLADDSGGADLTTIAGANPGDNLIFGAPLVSTAEIGTMTIDFPVLANAVSFEADDGCSTTNATPGFTLDLPHLNHCPATADLLLTAVTSGDISARYIDVPNQMFTNNGTVDLTAMTWTQTPSMALNFTDIPPALETLLHLQSTVANMSNSRPSAHASSSTNTMGTTATSMLFVPPAGSQMEAVNVVQRTDSVNWGVQVVQEIAPIASSYSLDVGAALMSWVDTTSVALDPTTGVVSWSTGASDGAQAANSATLMVVDAYYNRGNMPFHWEVYAPPTTSALTLPTLPPAFSSFAPAISDTPSADIFYVGFNSGVTYDSVHNDIDFLLPYTFDFFGDHPNVTRVVIDGSSVN